TAGGGLLDRGARMLRRGLSVVLLLVGVGEQSWSERARVETAVVLVRGHALRVHRAQARDQTFRQRALARQLGGVGVERRQRAAPGIEGPARVVLDLIGGELQLDGPAGLVLPARPAFVGGAEIGELRAYGDAEGRLSIRLDLAADQDGHGERLSDDVLPLG